MKSISLFHRFIWACFFVIAALLCFRILYSGDFRYVFLVWNLFLAWIPYIISIRLQFYSQKQSWKQLVLLGTWLLFFPNALYIVTDLVHLRADTNTPWWFDAMFLFLNAFVGLLLAFASLLKVETFLRSRLSHKTTNLVIGMFLLLGSYGVYLGRFERWNSWNVIDQPFYLVLSIINSIVHPFENWKVWAITILFASVYSLIYYSIKMIPLMIKEQKNTGH